MKRIERRPVVSSDRAEEGRAWYVARRRHGKSRGDVGQVWGAVVNWWSSSSGPKGHPFAQPGPTALESSRLSSKRPNGPAVPLFFGQHRAGFEKLLWGAEMNCRPVGPQISRRHLPQGRWPWLDERMALWAEKPGTTNWRLHPHCLRLAQLCCEPLWPVVVAARRFSQVRSVTHQKPCGPCIRPTMADMTDCSDGPIRNMKLSTRIMK